MRHMLLQAKLRFAWQAHAPSALLAKQAHSKAVLLLAKYALLRLQASYAKVAASSLHLPLAEQAQRRKQACSISSSSFASKAFS